MPPRPPPAPALPPAAMSDSSSSDSDADRELCIVCAGSTAEDPAKVLVCDGCDSETHLRCAGLSRLPNKRDAWHCAFCVRVPVGSRVAMGKAVAGAALQESLGTSR